MQARYNHLERDTRVQTGDLVSAGQVIGTAAAHMDKGLLKIELRESTNGARCEVNASNTRTVNPMLFFDNTADFDDAYLTKPMASIPNTNGGFVPTQADMNYAANTGLTGGDEVYLRKYVEMLFYNSSMPQEGLTIDDVLRYEADSETATVTMNDKIVAFVDENETASPVQGYSSKLEIASIDDMAITTIPARMGINGRMVVKADKMIALRNTYVPLEIVGTLKYKAYTDGRQSYETYTLKNYEVEIVAMSYNGTFTGRRVIATAKTDSAGKFKANITNEVTQSGKGRTIWLRVKAKNDYVTISRNHILDGNYLVDKIYSWESSGMRSDSTEETQLNFGVIDVSAPDSNIAASLNIYHWIKTGSDFYFNETRSRPRHLEIYWEEGKEKRTAAFSKGFIELNDHSANSKEDHDEYDASVILHEYAHQIMNEFASFNIGLGGGSHRFSEPSNINTAYKEGWADFFSVIAKENVEYRDYHYYGGIQGTDFYGFNIDTWQGIGKNATIREQVPYLENSKMEAMIASAFYHLSEKYSFKLVDAFVRQDGITDINKFYEAFFKTPYVEGQEKEIWQIFHDANVAYDITPPKVTITQMGNSYTFTLTIDEDIAIEKIVWYVNDNLILSAQNSNVFSDTNLVEGDVISVRVFDPAGNANRLPAGRTETYGGDSFIFYKR